MKDISGETLDYYLAIADKKYGDDLSIEETKKIFDVAINDFKEGNLYLDLLSHVCDYLWSKAYTKSMTDQELYNFTQMLYWIAELNYYLRNMRNRAAESDVLEALRAINNYKRN